VNKYFLNQREEIEKIINSEHSQPHNILGMHEIICEHRKKIIINCFLPYAKKVWIVNLNLLKKKYLAKKIHDAGFFTVIIPEEIFFDYKIKILDCFDQEKIFHDAYKFIEPVLSDLDLYLFSQATHYKIFDKLGAHEIKFKNISGINFAVWAPNAKRVSIIGNFNNWDGRQHPMRVRGNSGVWELFIPELKTNELYKFEIKTQENYILKKSDPYANFCELRPKTASVIFNLNKFKWQDNNWMAKRKNNLNRPINIYEAHIGSWKRICEENNRFMTYREFADQIVSYLLEMNYTHLELMGILEHPFDGSWGYQVTGYYAPTSRYGNPEDFMYLINKLHENNIGVILDWVPAHFPKDDHGLVKFDGSYLYEHADPRAREHFDWGTLIFNYGRYEVKNFLIANAIFWIEKFHIDGLRVDAVASMLYLNYSKKSGEWIPNRYGTNENLEAIEFLKHLNSVINKFFSGVLIIAEESTAWLGVSRPVEQGGLGFNLKWNMGWMNDFLRYMQKDCIYRKYHHSDLTFSMIYAYTENFILVLSHDEVVHGKKALINKMPGDIWQKFANLKVAFGFMIGHPGKKLSFMGNEIAQFEEWSESKSLDWHLLDFDLHNKFKNYMRDLNKIYLKESCLWESDFDNSGFEWINCEDYERSVISFLRKNKSHEIIIFVCNFTPVPLMDHKIGVPDKSAYQEILNSDDSKYGGSGIINPDLIYSENINYNHRSQSINLKIPPLGVVILKQHI